jgi:CTP synthase (UTP-ammonia lyase)
MSETTRIALVGDRSPQVRAHVRMPTLLESLRRHERIDLDTYWIPTDDISTIDGLADSLAGFDGIWLVPGSPYRSEAGAVEAVRVAREGRIPFLGTCGGFQHAMIEYARHVCGLTEAAHAENSPEAEHPLIAALSCSLVGHEGTVRIKPGTLAERIMGTDRSVERYHCAYGIDAEYVDVLARGGLCFSSHDDDGAVRIVELPDHPFFIATLFQPELADSGPRTHPVIRAFAAAAADHAAARVAVG